MCRRFSLNLVAIVTIAGCTDREPPTLVTQDAALHFNHNAAADAGKGYIAGWYNGEDVDLRYTKLYYCAEPPESLATTGCEIGADAELPPRGGRIPVIYAIVAAGIQPDPATLSCAAGTPCLNHPAMIDLSRIGGRADAGPAAHSHILESRQGGWHQTTTIRVFNLELWNQIATAKSIDALRALRADPANAGKISADSPTNIFFFLEVQRDRSR